LELAPVPASVGEARRFTIETLSGWRRDDIAITAALLVTELVTNAILHARTVVYLRLERQEHAVRVEVRDGSPARPALRHHSLDSTTGRGLALVARLARTWGVDVAASGAGKTVWVNIQPNADEQWSDKLLLIEDEAGQITEGSGDDGQDPGAAAGTGSPVGQSRVVAYYGRCA
jgi:anti-sigma regulatory factor (Ser/Thr protein kinase)